MTRLLKRNTALAPSDALGWKHGFPTLEPVPADLLVVCVVRNAVAWALSMHAKPWHTPPEMQALAFSEFIRAPWETIFDRPRYFAGIPGVAAVGRPLQQDRHPETGAALANLFALRRHKLKALSGFAARDCSSLILRLETVQGAPESTLAAIRRALGAPAEGHDFRPVHKRLGSRFKPAAGITRPQTPTRMAPEDIGFMRGELDLDLEARLGYAYGTAES
ncbi:hypothetical protein R5H30_06665 [Sulfitobacter sp. D35]|uniref:hypothetical protein n=1 Tax=Sulfitobacter sp. D35 TaxID=3083252 RepID=UPI00296E97A6|nr:hypothetical protein [Sulfitobacter sp. D35]MDW4497656.1 hypothetical protein [Sulfitobacter sp. D35]